MPPFSFHGRRKRNRGKPCGPPLFLDDKKAAWRGLFLVMLVGVAGGVVDARLVGMLVGMQAVAVCDMGVMRRLVVVARLMMVGGFMVMLGGLLVVMSGLAMMFSAFVTCRHIDVLLEVITL
jgi:hypothetical protein